MKSEIKLVLAENYGINGLAPLKGNCPIGLGMACISGSGDSLCGGYMGHDEVMLRGEKCLVVSCLEL